VDPLTHSLPDAFEQIHEIVTAEDSIVHIAFGEDDDIGLNLRSTSIP